MQRNLCLLNYFFLFSLPVNFPCAYLGNFLSLCVCLLCTWLSRDNHLASIVSGSPSFVKRHTNKGGLRCSYAKFLLSDILSVWLLLLISYETLQLTTAINIGTITQIRLTLSNIPDIIVMGNGGIAFMQPLINLFVSVHHQNFYSQFLLL